MKRPVLLGSIYSISSYNIILCDISVALNLHRKINLLEVLCCVYRIKPAYTGLKCCGFKIAFHVSMGAQKRW